jgi:hypothetical protein
MPEAASGRVLLRCPLSDRSEPWTPGAQVGIELIAGSATAFAKT